MPTVDAANTRVARPALGDGEWRTLGELRAFELALLAERQRDPSFSDVVRLDNSPAEKLRRDELVPFLYMAHHESLPDATLFRKPQTEQGIDLEYAHDGTVMRLQITKAYPVWLNALGEAVNGGYQYRLHMEKLTANGFLSGTGPFERRGGEIVHHEGCDTWDDKRAALLRGLIAAFEGKASHGSKDITLLVHAETFHMETCDARRFHDLIEDASHTVFPCKFGRVMVVDYGEGFKYNRRIADGSLLSASL